MTATRNPNKAGPITGQAFVDQMVDTAKAFANYSAGNALSPSGTNAVEFTIDVMAGLTGIPDGFELNIIPPNTNTGSMTLEITGIGGTKSAVEADGTAFSGGEIIGGTAHKFVFFESSNHWRRMGAAPSVANGKYPLLYTELFNTPGAWSWDAPWDCDFEVIAIGGGGGGARYSNYSTGGSAGGTSRKFASIESGQTISGTIGSGGAAVSSDSAGNDGVTTTVTSSDITIGLNAPGGEGGSISESLIPGPSGPIGTGGDVNFAGGAGGSFASLSARTGGGGGPGLIANGEDGSGRDGGGDGISTSLLIPPFGSGFNGGDGSDGSPTSGTAGSNGGGGGSSSTGTSGAGGNGLVIIRYSANTSS